MENLEYARVCGELQGMIGAHIENIYQLDEENFRFKIGSREIACTVGVRLHETKYVPKETGRITNFVEFLRSRIRGGRVLGIAQMNNDRIVRMGIGVGELEYFLVFEMFGGGNIILLDGNNVILRALVQRKWKEREIFPKREYALPPAPVLSLSPSLSEMKDIHEKKYAIAVFSRIPLGLNYMREALRRAGVGERENYSEVGEGKVKKVLLEVERIRGENVPSLYSDENGKIVQFACAKLACPAGVKVMEAKTLCEAADEYYFGNVESVDEKGAKREGEIEKVKERIGLQEEQALHLEKEYKMNMECAKGIYDNFEAVEEEIKKARKRGERKAEVEV